MEKFPFLAAPLPVLPAVVVPRLLFSCCSSSGMPRAPQPPQLGSAPSTQPCPAGMGQSQAGCAAVGLSRAPSPSSPHWQWCWHRGTRPVWVHGTAGTDAPSLAIPSQGWVQAANPGEGVGGAGGAQTPAQTPAAPSSGEPCSPANGPMAPQLWLGTLHSTAPAPGSSQGRDKASPGGWGSRTAAWEAAGGS